MEEKIEYDLSKLPSSWGVYSEVTEEWELIRDTIIKSKSNLLGNNMGVYYGISTTGKYYCHGSSYAKKYFVNLYTPKEFLKLMTKTQEYAIF